MSMHVRFPHILLLSLALACTACAERTVPEMPPSPDTGTTPPTEPDPRPEATVHDRIMAAVRSDNPNNVSDIRVDDHLELLDPQTGRFKDINYDDPSFATWQPIHHLERVRDFVYAYTNSRSSYQGSEELHAHIVQTLRYWQERHPRCRNWWYNQVQAPKLLGLLLIWMRQGDSPLPEALETQLLDRMAREGGEPDRQTGANRADVALHCIYRACLTADTQLLDHAFSSVYRTLAYTSGEGIQQDLSFFQHGPQLYIGGYGDVFLKSMTQIANYGWKTPYALQGDQLELLSRFMRGTFYPTIRGNCMSFNVMGRSVSRPNALRKQTMAVCATRMQRIDPAHAAEYKEISDRLYARQPAGYQVTPSHTHFYIGDYTLHVRPTYTFDVRMVSRRTVRCENGNGENLKGYHISDGSTAILVDGDEYYNIFPAWDWLRVPGTTARTGSKVPFAQSPVRGTAEFAGGVSDGLYGCSGLSYEDRNPSVKVDARKSWFFFDDEVVALGQVRSTTGSPLQTTVNQCLAKGSVPVRQDSWVYHNHVGYLFPQGGKVRLDIGPQTGSWASINSNRPASPVTTQVFSLGLEHPFCAEHVPYAYVVVPGIASADEMQRYASAVPVEVVTNTVQVQAVWHSSLQMLQCVFFEPARIACAGMEVEALDPCILMLRLRGEEAQDLHIADPTRSRSRISVVVTAGGKTTRHDAKLGPDGMFP